MTVDDDDLAYEAWLLEEEINRRRAPIGFVHAEYVTVPITFSAEARDDAALLRVVIDSFIRSYPEVRATHQDASAHLVRTGGA